MIIDPATGEIVEMLDVAGARRLTDEIKSSAEHLWMLLCDSYERRAWAALGYESWRAYATAEFGMDKSYAYRLLDQARVVSAIETALSPNGEISIPASISEAAARDLKPRLAEVTERIRTEVAALPEADRPAAVRQVIDEERAATVANRQDARVLGIAAGRAAGAAASIPQRPDPGMERAAEAWQLAQTRLSAWNVLARRAIECSGHLAVDDHYREPNVWGATIRSAREALDQIEETLANRAPMRRVK